MAAGSGTRFGGPKQIAPLAGRRVLDWSIDIASKVSEGVVVVVPDELVAELRASSVGCTVVAGGASRSASVRAGLAAVPAAADTILVHDGARPMANTEIFARVIEAVRRQNAPADAALPAVAVTDTIREIDGGVIDRSRLVAVQTPQAFRAEALRVAHGHDAEATDDVALVEAIGGKVMVVDGNTDNLKITTPNDLVIADALMASRPEAAD